MPKTAQPELSLVEHRAAVATAHGLELRADGDKPATLVGYAAIFNTRTDMGWFEEEIAPGAFAESLRSGADVRALYNHDSGQVIGRRTAGTLRLEEDSTGLRVEIDLPDTTAARDLQTNIAAGNIDGMSFGFRAIKQEWTEDDGQPDRRRLIECELIEVSAVTFPAYPDTSIAKRSHDAARKESNAGRSVSDQNRSKPQPSVKLLRARAARHKL